MPLFSLGAKQQIKRAAFKNWFGDWQQAAQAQRLTTGAPVVSLQGNEVSVQTGSNAASIKQMRADARAWGKTITTKPGQPYTNRDTGLQVEIRPRGIKETLSHNSAPNKIRAMAALPELIRNGVVVYDGESRKRDGQRFVAIAAKVRISGQDFLVMAGMNEDMNGRLFYDHELMEMERADKISSKPGLAQSGNSAPDKNTAPAARHAVIRSAQNCAD